MMFELNKHEFYGLILGFSLYVFQGINYSQLAPYFPNDAQNDKGVSTTVIGLITGAFDISDMFAAFLLASFMSAETQKLFFCYGAFISAVCSILFGCMEHSVGGSPYIIVCFFIRFVMGIGASMVWSTGVLIMVPLVPEYSEAITTWTESCIGLGIAFGPPVGSFLYTFGGFLTPFLSLGIIQLLLTITCVFYIPNPIKNKDKKNLNLSLNKKSISEKDPGLNFFYYITRPYVLCASIPLFMQSMSFGFFEVAVGPYLEDYFCIGGSFSGYYFLPFAITYALAILTLAPLIERGYAGYIYLTSIFISALSFTMLWTPDTFPIVQHKHWLTFWLAAQGLAISGSFVPASIIFEMLAFDIGFKDNQNVKLVVTSWLNACFAIGRKFGPLVTGGFFLDLYGFYNSCLLQAGIVIVTFMFAWFVSWKKNLLVLRRYSIGKHPEYELASSRFVESENIMEKFMLNPGPRSQFTKSIGF